MPPANGVWNGRDAVPNQESMSEEGNTEKVKNKTDFSKQVLKKVKYFFLYNQFFLLYKFSI